MQAFSSSDRATRVHLLKNVEKFVEPLDEKIVNKSVFPPVCTGFSDTNPAVREQTVKSMLTIGPKLNENNINIELMKHFAKLQAKDDQAPIRCNTTICLGKLVKHLNPETKQKVLNSAFNRAMKDPFPPARQAGLNAILANASEYKIKDLAMKMLPGITPLLCDPVKNVRVTALKAARQFLKEVEKASSDPAREIELFGNPEQQNKSTTSSDAAKSTGNTSAVIAKSGWLGSAMSMASSMASKKAGAATSGSVSEIKKVTEEKKNIETVKPAANKTVVAQNHSKTEVKPKTSGWDDGNDGWDDEDAGMDDVEENTGNGWDDDDDFKDADSGSDYGDVKPKQPEIPKSQLTKAKNDLSKGVANLKLKGKGTKKEDDMWGDLGGEKNSNDGWGNDNDDGNDGWGQSSNSGSNLGSSATKNKSSSVVKDNWEEDWSGSKVSKSTTAAKTVSKPAKLSPATRRKQLEEKRKQRLADREAKKKPVVKQKTGDDWGNDDW